jgi:hypothetical protein
MFVVGMKCGFALKNYGFEGKADELASKWRKLMSSGTWNVETPRVDKGVFNEPKCCLCWNFIAPLESVACIGSPDIPSHLGCANLCSNKFAEQIEPFVNES